MEQYGIGQPVRRLEDPRFLTGAGVYLDDVSAPGLTHLVLVRSTHPHARVDAIHCAAAAGSPGVVTVLTGADWNADGLGGIPTRTPAKNSDGRPVPKPERPGVVADRVRFVGDVVAVVVAETLDQARDAAERVEVDYTPLPAHSSAGAALAQGAAPVWDHLSSNVCVDFEAGDAQAVDAALASAEHVITLEVDNQRVTAVPIEPRGALGRYHREGERYTLICSTQNVHANRKQLAEDVFKVDPVQMRQVAPDVGGGFGAKNPLYPEHAIVLWAARRVGRDVKWVSDRSEAFQSDCHGRDQQSKVTLGLDREGRFLGLRVRSVGSLGPYVLSTGPFTSTGGTARTQGGAYYIPAVHFHGRSVFTHTTPTDPYRGAGRPEASFQLERIIEVAATTLGFDPVTIRRLNLLKPQQLPYATPTGANIDCGAFEEVLDRALGLAEWESFELRAHEAKRRGKLRGRGVCYYLECSGGAPKEYAHLRCEADGAVTLAVGSQSTGMGHETTLAQIAAAHLGIPIERIRFLQGDTDATPHGGGHGGSRGMEMGGSAVLRCAQGMLEQALRLAGDLLEAAPADMACRGSELRVVGTDRAVSFDAVVAASYEPSRVPDGWRRGLETEVDFPRDAITYPNGCHVAEVEVDPETGVVTLERYTVVDDFGTIINPLTTEGQVAGGSVQGIGQALMEKVVYDEEGQLLSGSLMDYGLPRARDLPPIEVAFFEGAPTANNPLGAKGAGEAGCCGALPSVVNAVMDALKPYGIIHIDMPLTPLRVWESLHSASRGEDF